MFIFFWSKNYTCFWHPCGTIRRLWHIRFQNEPIRDHGKWSPEKGSNPNEKRHKARIFGCPRFFFTDFFPVIVRLNKSYFYACPDFKCRPKSLIRIVLKNFQLLIYLKKLDMTMKIHNMLGNRFIEVHTIAL